MRAGVVAAPVPRGHAGVAAPPRHAGSERGGVTVIAAVAATALLSVLGVIVQLGMVTIARHRAGSAADAAAIAGAGASGGGPEMACDRAASLAAANGGRLDLCEVIGLDVRVVVSLGAGLSGRVTSRARAGPVREPAPAR